MNLTAAPRALTEPLAFGRFAGAVADPGLAAFDARQRGRRRLERKAWLYLGLYHPDYTLGCALVDAGLLSVAFCYFVTRNGEFVEEKLTLPLGFPAAFRPRLDGEWRLARGARRFSVAPYAGGWELSVEAPALRVTAHVEHDVRGLTAVAPVAGRPFTHTYKAVPLTADARVAAFGREAAFEGRIGAVDFTAGYPARRTFWNWASAAGEAVCGARAARFGLNLCAPFNDGLENALWLDGRLTPLPPVRFDVPASGAWRLAAAGVDLAFAPEGERKENLNLGLLMSRFRQPFGAFSGRVEVAGESWELTGRGVCEEHAARW